MMTKKKTKKKVAASEVKSSGPPSCPDASLLPSTISEALFLAQTRARAIDRDARDEFHQFNYVSTEQMILTAQQILQEVGVRLDIAEQEVEVDSIGRPWLKRVYHTMHVASDHYQAFSQVWPIVEGKGKPLDKATASAMTSSLGYFLRDLLLLARVEKGTELDGNDPETEKPVVKVVLSKGETREEAEDKAARDDINRKLVADYERVMKDHSYRPKWIVKDIVYGKLKGKRLPWALALGNKEDERVKAVLKWIRGCQFGTGKDAEENDWDLGDLTKWPPWSLAGKIMLQIREWEKADREKLEKAADKKLEEEKS
jgi:hypothetical protein